MSEKKISSKSMEAAMVARLFKDALESANPIVAHFVWERDDGQILNMGMPKPHPSFPSAALACKRLDQRIGQWVSGEREAVDKNALVRLEIPGLAQFDFSLESFEKSALSDDGALVVGIGLSKGIGREPMAIAKVVRLKVYGADGKAVGRRQALLPIKEIINIQKREREAQAKKLAAQEQQIDEGMDVGRFLAQEEDRQWAEDSHESIPAPVHVQESVEREQADDGMNQAKVMMDTTMQPEGKNLGVALKINQLPVAQTKKESSQKPMPTGGNFANEFEGAGGESPLSPDQWDRGNGAVKSNKELGGDKAWGKLSFEREQAIKKQEAAEKVAQETKPRQKAEREVAVAGSESEQLDSEKNGGLAKAKEELVQDQQEKSQALALVQAQMLCAAKNYEEQLASLKAQTEGQLADLSKALDEASQRLEKEALGRAAEQSEWSSALAQARRRLEEEVLGRSEDQREWRARLDQDREELERVKKALEIAMREKTPSQVKASSPGPALDIDFVKAVFPRLPDGVDEIFISMSKSDLFAALERLESMGELEMRLASKNETHINVGICVPAGKVAMLADFIGDFSKGGVMVKRSNPKVED
jgi:hypothetical protein